MNLTMRPMLFSLWAILVLAVSNSVWAASHSDAPLIKQDPQANITDVYAFIGNRFNDPDREVLNVVVGVRPFSEPGDGVIYDRFADDALYSIHIADPNSGATDQRYDFRFSDVNPVTTPGLKNPGTILSYGLGAETGSIKMVGDARQNFTQTYTVARVADGKSSVIATGLHTPPPNVGLRTTPKYNDPNTGMAVSGALSLSDLDDYTRDTIFEEQGLGGRVFFAGLREDGFYGDIPGIFDLLDPRIVDNDGDTSDGLGQDGGGVDGFKGFNVLVYAIQIPLEQLNPTQYNAIFADLGNSGNPLPSVAPATGVGVYASVSRPRSTRRNDKNDPVSKGSMFQINRMGNPLFNEALVALQDKDNFNRRSPTEDTDFATYAENPELAVLINLAVFGDTTGQSPLVTSGRSDLSMVYIPDVLRVDTTTGPVPLAGQTNFNRLGFIGGDSVMASDGRFKSSGWPNGRRFGDDVVDIALSVIASGPEYNGVLVVGDNVAANDQVYHQVFPYAATPHSGTRNRKDSLQ